MVNLNKKHVYDGLGELEAFRRVSILRGFPGIDARFLFSDEDKVLIGRVPIEDYYLNYEEQIYQIFNKNKELFRGFELFGIVSGKEILKQDLVEEDFVFFVFAAYNHFLKKWVRYEDLKRFECDLLRICPKIGDFKNEYDVIKKECLGEDVFTALLQPYPDDFITKKDEPIFVEFPNHVYRETKIDYKANPSFVYSDLRNNLEFLFDRKHFRKLLSDFSFKNELNGIESLKGEHLDKLKSFCVKVLKLEEDLLGARVKTHFEIFEIMICLRVREWFLDFLVKGII